MKKMTTGTKTRKPRAGNARRQALTLAALASLLACPAIGHAQTAPVSLGSSLLRYTDIGQADILLTAASIRQSNGNNLTGTIDQTLDTSSTDRTVYPIGTGNIADIEQSGSYIQANLVQNGNLNRLRVVQSGSNNSVSATQLGTGNVADLSQSGMENSLTIYQNGNGNLITATQVGNGTATLQEIGNNNVITMNQPLNGKIVSLTIIGNGQRITVPTQ
ncbi:MAG: hypothetical protein JO006_19175 [Paucibacter sp.]|nr:hypothetical protein [Roseateles sp.]